MPKVPTEINAKRAIALQHTVLQHFERYGTPMYRMLLYHRGYRHTSASQIAGLNFVPPVSVSFGGLLQQALHALTWGLHHCLSGFF